MHEIIQRALDAYTDGDERYCRQLLETLVSDTRLHPPDDEAPVRQRPTIAALDWLCLALDRLRGSGLVPVPLALRSALNALGSDVEGS